MSDLSTRALVLRHAAALRRQGLTALAAVERVGEGLPPGAVREDCVLAARTLASGGAETRSDFTRVLTDATGAPEQAEALAESFDAQLDADDALGAPTFLLQLVLCGPLVLLSLMGWLFQGSFLGFGDLKLPAPTQGLLGLAEALRLTGVPLAVALLFGVRAVRRRLAPGFPAFTRAARVLAASTLPEGSVDVPALQLNGVELQVLEALRAHGGFSHALRTLALELTREGRSSVAAFRALAPVFAVFVVVQVYLSVLVALYLPIFSIAGSIK